MTAAAIEDTAMADDAVFSTPVTLGAVDAAVTTAPPAFVQVNSATPQTNQSSVAVKYTGAQVAGDTNIVNDLPNETGSPNRAGTGTGMDDNHDTITGSNTMGKWDGGPTCSDWTSATGSDACSRRWPTTRSRSASAWTRTPRPSSVRTTCSKSKAAAR